MLNRWILVLLALALPFMGAGAMGLNAAPSVDGDWDPDTASLAGFEGLPDLARDSAKFMVITGDNNQSIGLEPMQVGITVPAAATDARIALFDADSTGLWDQRAGDAILLFAPRVQYEVFVDPDGSVLAALAALPPLPASTDPDTQLTPAEVNKRVVKCFSNDAAFANTDNKWAALYDRATSSTEVQSAKAANGDFKFVFRATLLPNSPPVPDFPGAPGTGIQGTERVGFKLAYNGTYLLKAGDVLAFAGGSIDERYFIVASDTEQANTQDPLPGAPIPGTDLTNAYDGKFNFPFHHSWFKAGDVQLFEGDADWNANIPLSTIDMAPTGVPPDNGGLYDITLPVACQPAGYVKPVFFKRDSSMFKVGTPIRWFIFPIPAGGHLGAAPENPAFPKPLFSSDPHPNREAPLGTWPNHASVNAFCQQSLAPNNTQANAPFDYQYYPLSKAVVDTKPGLWCVRWDGVDASNFVFMKFDSDIGSTPRDTTIEGRVFCDEDSNGIYDPAVDGPLGVALNLSAQQVDPATGVALNGVNPIAITTDVMGAWGPIAVPAGRYLISITTPHMLSPVAPVTLPLDVTIATGSCDKLPIPLNCKQPISGRVFCDNNGDCIYQPAPGGTDTALPAAFLPATVQLQQVDGLGNPVGAAITVQTDNTGAYTFPANGFGTYQISIVPQIPLPTNCPATLTVTLGINTGPSTGNDFGYLCETMGCGFLWCDDNKNGVFDAGEPALGLPDYTVEVRPTGQPAATPKVGTAVQGVPGRWCVMGLTPGVGYTATVKYKGTTTLPKNVTALNGLTQTFTAVPPPTMTPDTNFTFVCEEEVCGYVFCDTNNNGIYDAGTDIVLQNGWTVEVTPSPQTTPATAAIVVTPDATKGGQYCVKLPFGTYTFAVKYQGGTNWPFPNVLIAPANGQSTVTVTETSTNGSQDFAFKCEVSGKVYCDENGNNVFDAGDLPLGAAPWLVTFTSATNPTQTVVPNGLNMGTYAANLPEGSWTATITYAGGTNWPAPVTSAVSPTTVNFTVPQAQAPNLDFIFKCALTPTIDVFCDDNTNGTLDTGENRLVGPAWTVTISGGPAGFTPITLPVGPNGQVVAPALPLGTYSAAVLYNGGTTWPTNPEIVTALGATTKQFTLAAGTPPPSISFPFACKTGQIKGTVFCDDNVNGVKDAGENRLVGPDWTVTVAGGPAGFTPVVVPVAADGTFSTAGLPAGTFTATVLYKGTSNWPTNPEIVAALGPTTQNFTISAAQLTPPDLAFPFSCNKGSIKGTVFCDDNVNGTKDAGENRLVGPAWTVTIAGPAGFTPVVVPVAADGSFAAGNLPAGNYTATVLYNGGTNWPTNPEIVSPLGPTTQNFAITVQQLTPPDLAFPFSCKTGSIKGTVFCDENVNGVKDAGENRLVGPAWTVTIAGPAGFTPVVVPVAPDGTFSTTGLPAGAYTATVLYNGGTNWPTNPEIVSPLGPTTQNFTISAAQPIAPDLAFPFSCKKGRIKGAVFCDDNTNGTKDAGENRLVGPAWTVTVAGGPAGFTPVVVPVAADGTFDVSGLPGGNYTATVLYNGGTNWPTNPEIVSALGPTTQNFTISAAQLTPTDLAFPFSCTKGGVKGTVFCDDNTNGTKDAGENRLVGPAWTVTIAGGPAGFTPVVVPVAADGSFNVSGLPAGAYTATVLYNGGTNWPTNPEIVSALGPTTQNFTITAAQPNAPDLAFPFSCVRRGDICVKVYCDVDCDGVRDANEPAYAGAKIELKDAQGNLVPPAWISTVNPDEFCWKALPPGAYTLNLDGTSLPVNVEASTPTTVSVNLGQGGVARGEFGICKLGKICGIAFEEAVGNWDKVYQAGETPLPGVVVQLTGGGLAAPVNMTTGNDGRFCFEKLKPGTYNVQVLLPTPANLGPVELTTNQTVNVTLPSGGTGTADFAFATAEVAGTIWNETDMTCDGSFDAGDMALAGVDVTLTGLTGNAVGTQLTTQTLAGGTYAFLRLPSGSYEVKVGATANNVTLLKDLLACGPTLATPNVPICERTVVDFSYYPCIQDLKVTVFVDKSLPENCTYDNGTDLDLSGVTFTVHPQGDQGTLLATGVTTANGTFTVNGLAAGTYWVCIDGSQDALANLEQCVAGDCVTVVLEPCKDECLEIGYKETCRKEPCCEGKLHEVVFKTHIWVGDCDDCFAVSAHLMETCDPYGGVSGEAWMDFCGDFPGPVTGYDGVVTIENVEVENGIALVTVRLTATGDEFLRGYFDDGKHLLAVFVNGKSNEACVGLRCEDTLPGAMFPYSKDCGPKPDCNWTQDFADKAYERWIACECAATFIVCEQCSYEWWKRCVPCVSKPESKVVDLKFRNCRTDGDDHEMLVKLKWNNVVYDMITFEFDGDTWTGSKTGANGHVTVLKAYKDGKDWRARIRIDYDCGCPEGALPSRIFVWAGLDCCSLDKIVKLPCEPSNP